MYIHIFRNFSIKHITRLKSLLFLLIVNLVLVSNVEAVIIIPFFNITIIQNSIDGDAIFDYDLKAESPYEDNSQTFQIQTVNGHGSYLFSGISGNGTDFILTQHPATGLQNPDVECISDNPQVHSNHVFSGISITAYPYSSITCTFSNKKQSFKSPVLIVPGVLGTGMHKGNEKLWLDIPHNLIDAGDQFMDPLFISDNLVSVDGSVQIDSVIRKEGNGIISYDYTAGLINEFIDQGYSEGRDLFTFPYDWRYGVSGKDVDGHLVNLDALQGQIDYILTETDAGRVAGKVDVIAHSTGGLLVKQYAISHPTDHHIDKLVMVGVPNQGSPKAIKVLTQGDNFGVPGLSDSEMKKLGLNMPVVYDLAPSQKYVENNGSFLHINNPFASAGSTDQDLSYHDAWDWMDAHGFANTQALDSAKNLHSASFDNFDLRNLGVDLYNIVGCKTGTFNKVDVKITKQGSGFIFNNPKLVSGDGTVPQASAASIMADADKTYFVPNSSHGTLMSTDNIRQEIVNLITGSSLDVDSAKIIPGSDLLDNPSLCKLKKGKFLGIFSPVNISVIDQHGNSAGLMENGSIQNDIPGADYEIFGEHKFVYLPTDENQTYSVNLVGTGNGTFTLKNQEIVDEQVVETEVFSNLPVTTELKGSLVIDSDRAILNLDNNGDGAVDQTLLPSSIVNSPQSDDLTPPQTIVSLFGSAGQENFYHSDVSISLTALDPVLSGLESQTSGLLETRYSLDGNPYQTFTSSIRVASEGRHTLRFFSTDKAGNNEEEQTINFTIDKTAPELLIKFDPLNFDLKFSSTDNVSIVDNDNVITATDQSGNQTQIILKDKERKKKLVAEIKSLTYNGLAVDLTKTVLRFNWNIEKKSGQLKSLEQHVKSKKDFLIDSAFANNQTVITGKDQTGKINQTVSGLVLVQIMTNKGDFNWSY